MKRRNRAFTLIELLIVVTVIGVLAAMILMAVNSARIKARDVNRKGDLRTIKTALEGYFADVERYPYNQTFDTDCTAGCPATNWPSYVYAYSQTNYSAYSWFSSLLGNYIKTLPTDPLNKDASTMPGNYYYYTTSACRVGTSLSVTAKRFTLSARLENQSDPETSEAKYNAGQGYTVSYPSFLSTAFTGLPISTIGFCNTSPTEGPADYRIRTFVTTYNNTLNYIFRESQ